MRRFFIRTGAVATAAMSAAALTALATAATAGPATATATAARASASVPACTASQLGVWVPPNQGNGAAGTVYYPLEFTNLSTSTCSMYGNPGVSAINSNGHQLGVPATWPSGATRHTVTLTPGATAHATLAYHDAAVGSYPPADHAQAFELRVYPPGQRSTQEAYWDLTALTNTVPFLSVGPIQAGIGTIYTS
jgi:Protein of unknown function (DUF4232)